MTDCAIDRARPGFDSLLCMSCNRSAPSRCQAGASGSSSPHTEQGRCMVLHDTTRVGECHLDWRQLDALPAGAVCQPLFILRRQLQGKGTSHQQARHSPISTAPLNLNTCHPAALLGLKRQLKQKGMAVIRIRQDNYPKASC